MKYNPDIHHRRSIRLKEYDYSQAGAYFVTICAHKRACILGKIVDGKIVLDELGKVVESSWLDLTKHYFNIKLDLSAIMPNHIHGIIFIVGARCNVPLRLNNLQNPYQIQYRRLSGYSNPQLPNELTKSVIPREFMYGNGIIMSM
jgi:REP element-mobilizing transposase RayT